MKRLFAVGMCLACVHAALGQTSLATTPVGAITYTLPDGSGTPRQVALYFGLVGTPSGQGVLAGTITGVTANTLSSANAGWAPGAFSVAQIPYLVRIVDGAAEGTTWQISTSVANTGDTITILNQGVDLTQLPVVAGDRFEIYPAHTLASLFTGELQGGPTASTADNVAIWNGSAWITYFFNTDLGYWVRSGFVGNAGNLVIRPDMGVMITRRGPAKSFTLLGHAPSSDLQLRLNAKETFLGTFPMGLTLAQVGLNETTGWVKGSQGQADRVSVWNGSAWVSYYHDGSNWRRVGLGTVSDNAPVQTAERPLMVSKKAAPTSPTFVHQVRPY